MMDTIIDILSYLEDTIVSILSNNSLLNIPTSIFGLAGDEFWHYLPFTPFLILIWPLLLTFVVTLASASTWIFWLLTSLLVGIVQLIYVMYSFTMIGFDLGVLTLLKTFALTRSYVRFYTIKSGFSKKGRNFDKNRVSRRGRRREWREKLDKAKDYSDYLDIEIQEPKPVEEPLLLPTQEEGSLSSSMKRIMGGKKGDKDANIGTSKDNSSTSTIDTRTSASSSSSQDPMKRINSCVHLDHGKIQVAKSPPRSMSNSDLAETMVECEDLEKELGRTGSMLVTTTARLREARLQASLSASVSASASASALSGGAQNTNVIPSISEDDSDYSHISTPPDSSSPDTISPGRDAKEYSSSSTMSPTQNGTNKRHQSGNDQAAASLKFLLSGVVKRNHLSVNDLLLKDARSVMECGTHELSSKARDVILGYHEEVERCLEWIAESAPTPNQTPTPVKDGSYGNPAASITSTSFNEIMMENNAKDVELSDRINLIRKLKHNMGRSALMLSGGGAQAMYHLGTIRALCQSDLYDDIEVFSGTSGGSITAGMAAVCTKEELLKDVCISTVSTDYRLNGEMKKKNIRWFPKVTDMGAYWMRHKLLVDTEDFNRCCEYYFADYTFEEAFERTGKHVCITVSASRAGSGGAQRLLLNHISTPHVTIASAVAASCALPGVMAPAKLRTKNSDGVQELFEVDGVEWIDGSVQADLPFKRISTLFNVSNYIVCQTNFHVLPFLHKPHHPKTNSFYWGVFQTCEWDIRNRALNLSRLGLFPKIMGHDISKVFKQKYHGDITLVPRFTRMQLLGMKALVNPTVEDMEQYLQNGQSAAWPYVGVMKEVLRIEKAVDRCMARLNERKRFPDDWDEIESITSMTQSTRSRPYASSARRETELLKEKILALELENMDLRKRFLSFEKKESAPSPCAKFKDVDEKSGEDSSLRMKIN